MRSRSFLSVLTAIFVVAMMAVATPAAAQDDPGGTEFVATIENVSTPETLPTSTGSVAVPLSPGAYVVHKAGRNPLVEPRNAASTALEALAEDGDPSGFPALIKGAKVFNTPVGATAPGPLLPGGKYEFSFVANPGDEISLATMFVQSNDWFYSTVLDTNSIALFDAAGNPLAQDASDQLKLWESKTEVDEEPGTGANQAPRQSGPNTGPTESGQVNSLSSQGKSVKLNGPVIKLTIAPKGVTVPDTPTDPGPPVEPFDAADGMVVGRTGTLNGLNGLNVGPDGNVYIASVGGSEITVHNPETGEILDRIGQDRGVNGPDDVFITPDGTIYWTEILGGDVGMLKPDGTVKKQSVGPGVNPITMSDDGRLFVARVFLGDGLYELDPELEADPIALIPDLVGLNAFDFGPDGLLYGPLFFGGAVVKIDVDAATPVPETVVTGLNVPSAAKFNSAGELHIAEVGGGRILKADTATGDVEVLAQIEGTIDNLTFDANDRLFFAAGADNQIVRLTPGAGTDVFGEISLSLPGGVAVSPDGTVWVGDLFALRGFGDGADPVSSFYDRFAPPGTAFGGANSVFAYGDLLVTSTLFGNNVQVFNPATGEVSEDFRNLAGPTNAILHGDLLVASQLGATPGAGSVVDVRTGDVLLDGLPTPVGLASDGATLYVSDWATGTVTAVSDAGSTVIASGLTGPEGLAVDGDRLLVVEEGLDQLSAIDLDSGEVSPVIIGLDLGGPVIPGFAPFGPVTGVTVGDDGTIYVTQDGDTNALLKFGGDAPPDAPAPTMGFIDTLVADGRFTTLLAAIDASFLTPPPEGQLFTLLAPTDEAFAALPPGLLDDLLADPGFLTDVLVYHLIEGVVPAETIVTLTEARSALGAPIGIEVVDGMVVLNGTTNVIETDIFTTQGVIHVLDGVLELPPPPEPLGFLIADFARGSTEVPDAGDPNALSTAYVDVFEGDGTTVEVCVFVETTIQDPTVAHIHRGVAGVAGPVVVNFEFTAESWEGDQLDPAVRYADGCVDVAAELASEILAGSDGFYANIHSVRFPAGANREQLVDPDGPNPREFTAAPLLGSNVVPGPGDPDSGRGWVDFYLPVTETGEICYISEVFRVDDITSGHIHTGETGESGEVLVDLEYGSRLGLRTHPSGQGFFVTGCVTITPEALGMIQANPAGFYTQLHNEEFPAGAVRAQMVAGVGEIIRFADMAAPGGQANDLFGFANMALFPTQGLLCWDTPNAGIGQPTAMSISDAGGVVVEFDLVTHPMLGDVVDPFVEFTSFGCQTVATETLQGLVDSPNDYTMSMDSAAGAGGLIGVVFDPEFGPPPPDEGPPPTEAGIVASVVKAPIVPDGNVAGADTDFVITLDRSLDPSVDGRSLAAGDTIRITLPEDFINNGIDTGSPGSPGCVPGPCNVGVLLQGWPQHPIVPPAAKYSLALEGTHTFVYTALEDLGPVGPENPGIKQIHLILVGFSNPAAGDYDIVVEAQTGEGGAVETGTGTITILPEIAPSINITSAFNDGTPITIYQTTAVGQPTPLAYDFLMFDATGGPMTGVTLENGDLMRNGAKVGSVTISSPDGATGQSVTVAEPSIEVPAPVLSLPAGRLTAVFTAGSAEGDYQVTFSLDGGTSATMFVQAVAALPAPAGVELQILAINDFHGNIATTSSAFGGVGRADFLATNMAAAEAEAENSIIVSAGDLIGASPLISALFHDEPTIEAMNLIGLEINGVGNHEFDEGADELLRMQNGGSHPVDGDLDGDGFGGADFEFLAANVVDDASGETVFAPYTVKTYEGVDVAFIGMTLEGTPTIVTPAGVAGLTFNDEIETVNALIPELQADGIESIVVLLHEGGIASEGGGDGDGCGTLSGPLNDIVIGLDDAVDLVIGGHNNQRFACLDVDGKAVTMAYHSGRMFTDIDVVLDLDTGDMTVVSLDNKENFQEGVTPDADVTALIDRYDVLSAPLANRVIGSITTDITEETNDAGESALGDVIADAQLAATSSAGTGNAVVAFMNPGGIRDDFFTADVGGGEAPGEVTFGEAFSVQPFGNSLVTMTLTGTQIHTLLTQQWVGQENPRILQVSEGFSYSWDAAAADQDKVDATSIMIDGVLVDPTSEYRVTVNSFLSDGGDNFTVLSDGTNRLGGEVDLDALVTYFGANTPIAPGPTDRITAVGSAPASAKRGR